VRTPRRIAMTGDPSRVRPRCSRLRPEPQRKSIDDLKLSVTARRRRPN
jgi:hypothetical protein